MAEEAATVLRHHQEEEYSEEMIMPKVIQVLSSLLQRVAESNDQIISSRHSQSHESSSSVFHGLSRPTISVQTYLERIFNYANCSPCCYVIAYVYLDRFVKFQPSFPINSFNVHRLLITSVLVSAKFMDDAYYNNAFYAKVGGISGEEMNVLEMQFLFGLEFRLYVSVETFNTYCDCLQRHIEALLPPPLTINPRPLWLFHSGFSEDDSSHHHQLTV